MPDFEVVLRSDADPHTAWARLWDLDRHTSAVPLTGVTADGPLRLGSRFVARTDIGSVRVDDVMVVREWEPPRRAVVDKTGRVLGGTITVHLVPLDGGTRIRWAQTYSARGVPDVLAALARPFVAAGYRRTLRAILDGPSGPMPQGAP